MNRKKDFQKLKIVTKRIIKEYSPEKIILFGSWAWGKPTPDSDFDLFIVKKTRENRYLRQVRARRLIKGELPIDILVYTPEETERRLKMGDFFIKDVLKKGKVIYEEKRR